MSIDQALLEEFYGSEEQSDDLVKEAQAELIEAVADEAGVDLNTLSDDELDKFAEYVLTPEDADEHLDPTLATADAMGRQMAHSFIDEQEKLAHYTGDSMYDYQDTLLEKAAEWELIKEAKEEEKFIDKKRSLRDIGGSIRRGLARGTGYKDIMKGRQLGGLLAAGDFNASQLKSQREAFEALKPRDQQRLMRDLLTSGKMQGSLGGKNMAAQIEGMRRARKAAYMRGGAKATAVTAGLGGLGYLAMREKKSSYDPSVAWIEDLDGHEFAKLAEFRAAEILAANGVDPDTFEEIYPEHIKVANFPDPEDAHSWEAAQEIENYNDILDEAALDILEDLGLV
jgi:hypothetical protein